MESAWGLFVAVGGILVAGLTAATGPVYAYLMGRGICCDSAWPALNIGRDLARMKCCPYCGRSLDDELPPRGRHGKSPKAGRRWEDELA